jgi:hypothetical protein
MADLTQIGTGTITSGYTFFGNRGDIGLGLAGTDGRPYTLAQMKALALKQQSWEQQLQLLSVSSDIFSAGVTETVESNAADGVTIPNAIGMRISTGGQNSVHTMPVTDPATGRPIPGSGRLLGNERGMNMRFIQAYYNEQKYAIATQTRGVRYNYENAFGMYEKATVVLQNFWKETKGRQKRQCLVEWYPDELLTDNPGVTLTQHLNPNWIMNGVSVVTAKTDPNGTPIWNQDVDLFMDRVGEALITAGQNQYGIA